MNLSKKKKEGTVWVGTLLLITVLCYVALVVLQIMEWTSYGGPDSIWPT